jgi:hypothetical protein
LLKFRSPENALSKLRRTEKPYNTKILIQKMVIVIISHEGKDYSD